AASCIFLQYVSARSQHNIIFCARMLRLTRIGAAHMRREDDSPESSWWAIAVREWRNRFGPPPSSTATADSSLRRRPTATDGLRGCNVGVPVESRATGTKEEGSHDDGARQGL